MGRPSAGKAKGQPQPVTVASDLTYRRTGQVEVNNASHDAACAHGDGFLVVDEHRSVVVCHFHEHVVHLQVSMLELYGFFRYGDGQDDLRYDAVNLLYVFDLHKDQICAFSSRRWLPKLDSNIESHHIKN